MIPFHPYADLFPLIEGQEFEALVAGMKADGYRSGEEIILYDGKILDGRNRYRAGLAAGIFSEDDDPQTRWEFAQFGTEGIDGIFSAEEVARGPLAFVIAKNIHRRHLDESQRAMVAARIANLTHGGDRKSDQAANLPLDPAGENTKRASMGGVPQAEAASLLNVSERSVRAAKAVEELGTDELRAAVVNGHLAVSAAAQAVNLAPEVQREIAAEAVSGRANVARTLIRREEMASRRDRARELSDSSLELTGRRQVPCIYADPPWRRKAGIGDRAYENHYRTETWDALMALPVKELLLPDAWGFIWVPRAHMLALHPVVYTVEAPDGELLEVKIKTPLIWALARAWGFDAYSTCFVWTKTDDEHPDDIGTGLLVRDQDEILCLFRRGQGLPRPASTEVFGSNHRERSRPLGHSRKPLFYREMISAMTGGLPVLELFARADPDHPLPPNWEAWGDEAPQSEIESRAKPWSDRAADRLESDEVGVGLPSGGRRAPSSLGKDDPQTSASGVTAGETAPSLPGEPFEPETGEIVTPPAAFDESALDIPNFLRRSA